MGKSKGSARGWLGLTLAALVMASGCGDSGNAPYEEPPASGDGDAQGKDDGQDAPMGKLDARVARTDASSAPVDAATRADAAPSSVADSGALDETLDAGAPQSTPDAGPPDAGPPPLRPDLGKGDGSDVVTIGDSWMSNTLQLEGTGGGISPSLRSVSGQRYPNYAVQGVMLLTVSAFGAPITSQWDSATAANKQIKTVVMSAGGNDIIQNSSLQADCKNGGDQCAAKLKEIGAALKALWAKMSAAGVQDIVHILYAKSAGDGLKDADANNAALKELCDAVPAPTRCHLVSTDDLVGPNGIAIDGIHPTSAANDRIAKAIYKLMEDEHMRR